MSIWKRAILWTKLKDTFALGGLLGQAGMDAFATNEIVKIYIGVGTIIGYLVGMWMEDKDRDGVVDLFQTEVKTTVTSSAPVEIEITKTEKND